MFARVSITVVLTCAPAYAQHDHAADEHLPSSAFSGAVSLVAASFDTMLYVGNYQGVIPSMRWSNARFAAHASLGAYRLHKNGADVFGIGDAGAHGQATVWTTDSAEAGLALGITAPTGDARRGVGMGHVMAMPAVYGGWSLSRVRLGGSVGYSRALGNGSHDDHGPWPLVSPMLPSEVSWNAGGEYLIAQQVSAGARGSGGIPVGDGDMRAIVAGHVAWRAGRVESTAELQAGLAGDPFTVRGVVSTALSF